MHRPGLALLSEISEQLLALFGDNCELDLPFLDI